MWSCLKYNTRLLTLPAPPGPCALQLRYPARPHPASPSICHHLRTPSPLATVTLACATATAERLVPLAKRQEWEMEEEEDNPLDQGQCPKSGL